MKIVPLIWGLVAWRKRGSFAEGLCDFFGRRRVWGFEEMFRVSGFWALGCLSRGLSLGFRATVSSMGPRV